jgi:hypothetical protein
LIRLIEPSPEVSWEDPFYQIGKQAQNRRKGENQGKGYLVLLPKERQKAEQKRKQPKDKDIRPEDLDSQFQFGFFIEVPGFHQDDAQGQGGDEQGVYKDDVDIVIGIIVVGKEGHKKENQPRAAKEEPQNTLAKRPDTFGGP